MDSFALWDMQSHLGLQPSMQGALRELRASLARIQRVLATKDSSKLDENLMRPPAGPRLKSLQCADKQREAYGDASNAGGQKTCLANVVRIERG